MLSKYRSNLILPLPLRSARVWATHALPTDTTMCLRGRREESDCLGSLLGQSLSSCVTLQKSLNPSVHLWVLVEGTWHVVSTLTLACCPPGSEGTIPEP